MTTEHAVVKFLKNLKEQNKCVLHYKDVQTIFKNKFKVIYDLEFLIQFKM